MGRFVSWHRVCPVWSVYICYCRIGIYYYTYKSGLGTINLIQEIVDWAVAAGLVVGAMFLRIECTGAASLMPASCCQVVGQHDFYSGETIVA